MVRVKREILEWAIERSGKTLDTLKKTFPKLPDWISGSHAPTVKQLKSFAEKTFMPYGYLFLTKPLNDSPNIPFFRTHHSGQTAAMSANLQETIRTTQYRQSWYSEYLEEQGNEKLAFVGKHNTQESDQIIAASIRRELGLEENWASEFKSWSEALTFMIQAVENAGIVVVSNGIVGNNTHRKLDNNEFRGFVLVDDFAPFVFINNADYKSAQIFTLAHEICHVFLGASAVFDLRQLAPADDPLERKCNSVAAELLVPQAQLLEFWPQIKNQESRLDHIAKQFKVSRIVAARRALDLKLISSGEFRVYYDNCREDYEEGKKKTSSGGDYYRNQNKRLSQRFAKAVVNSAKEGSLLYSEAFRLTNMKADTFDKYASKLFSAEGK